MSTAEDFGTINLIASGEPSSLMQLVDETLSAFPLTPRMVLPSFWQMTTGQK